MESGFDKILKDLIDKKSESQKEAVSFGESKKLAEELFNRYQDKIIANSCKDVDGWGDPYTDYQKSIKHYLEDVPDNILGRFQGHGITRKSTIDQLAGALNILANKSIKGWCGRLGGETYGYGAYKTGDFLVVSRIDKNLPIEDSHGQTISNEIGWLADIGAFVIDVKFYPLVEELKNIFPDVNIIKANEIKNFIEMQIKGDKK